MNEKEIRDRFEGKKCETQMEFDRVMSEMNEVQWKLNSPYYDRISKYKAERCRTEAEINGLKEHLNRIGARIYELELEKKEINRLFHELKHELIMLNPRESFQKTETNKSEE